MASRRLSKPTAEKTSSSSPSPMKSLPSTAAAAPSPAKVGISEQIETPEKPVELPRRVRNQRVAFSVNEVKRVVQGIQGRDKELVDRKGIRGSDDDLLSLEEQLLGDRNRKTSKPKPPVKLPEKYEMLAEFFNCMDSSIRLLRLKGSTPTLSNICPSIQRLTERRFTYGHLAQLKYVLPEAILIKKVLVHDEVRCCMKPELQVSLQLDAIEENTKQNGESGYSLLRKVFRERLVDFSKAHPEEDDIPESELPHPFNRTNPILLPKSTSASMNMVCSSLPANTINQQQLTVSSHMPQSFQSRFSRKTPISVTEKTPLTCINEQPLHDNPLISVSPSPVKCPSNPTMGKQSGFGSPISLPSSNIHGKHEGAISKLCYQNEVNDSEETPVKLVSTPVRLMTSTPEILAPKRYCSTSMVDSPPIKKRATRTKLFQTPMKGVKTEDEETKALSPSTDNDVISFLPEALLHSIREKEKKTLMEKETGAASAKRRKKMKSSLPDIFNFIHLLFQSENRATMTKQELIYKIIIYHRKIVDRSEIEEQLKLLQEIVPDWISEKIASSGDYLICVNKICIPEEIRQRLAEAE
ncbi:hypothetical protein J5N97_024223 [Dioscorea zingiberensis]|uniref:CDT1 Geminin-binding domain-containing protein n=1 Tax=Dioscorea zingiberensis TaxID=325984 RepID=A0A9D5H8J9_9LILI|nr:hypothetical protein J5N97_024223 [Dioscorea zingiberensis]